MINALYWHDNTPSPILTAVEVDVLFSTCYRLASIGLLNGKYQHSCIPLFWVRLLKEN